MLIVGIFSTWSWSGLLEKPENIFKRNLEFNPVYPFEETEPNVFVLTVRSARFGLGLFLCLTIVSITTIIYSNLGRVDQMVIFPLLIGIGFLAQAIFHWKDRTYVLDNNTKMYEFYRGNTLIYTGHYHNVYIRLKGQNTGGGDIFYSIVLNGFEMDEEPITSSSTQPKKLAKLGRRLAHRLDLNFFDHKDKSRDHVIRHRCPYRYGLVF